MPDMTAIASALSSFKALKDIAEAMIGLRDAAAFRERQIEFQGKIIEAQGALFALQEERTTLIQTIRSLEEQVANWEAWDAKKKRYELKNVGHGCFVHMLKPEARGSKPPHFVCANCYEQRRISVIQYGPPKPGASIGYFCPSCGTIILPGQEAFAGGSIRWID